MRKILLYKNKVKTYDRSTYYRLFGGVAKDYNSMIKGAPILLNINGTLVDIKSLPEAAVHKRDLAEIERYVANVIAVNKPARIEFRLI